jgi:hypothetical protein
LLLRGPARSMVYWPEASVERSVSSAPMRYALYAVERTRACIAGGGRWIREQVGWYVR